jgi:hypothetical protein
MAKDTKDNSAISFWKQYEDSNDKIVLGIKVITVICSVHGPLNDQVISTNFILFIRIFFFSFESRLRRSELFLLLKPELKIIIAVIFSVTDRNLS